MSSILWAQLVFASLTPEQQKRVWDGPYVLKYPELARRSFLPTLPVCEPPRCTKGGGR